MLYSSAGGVLRILYTPMYLAVAFSPHKEQTPIPVQFIYSDHWHKKKLTNQPCPTTNISYFAQSNRSIVIIVTTSSTHLVGSAHGSHRRSCACYIHRPPAQTKSVETQAATAAYTHTIHMMSSALVPTYKCNASCDGSRR